MKPENQEADITRITEMVYAHPGHFTHETDLPYRLSSWSAQNPANVRLWEDANGRLLAFAIMQEPFLALDYFVHPAARSWQMEREMLLWANGRAPEVATEQGRTFPYHLFSRDESPEQVALWQALGLTRADYMDTVFMSRSLSGPIPDPTLPDGFVARPLHGSAEVAAAVAAHQAAFNSTNMRPNWRHAMLTQPQYRPELDTVMVAPDGRIAAFCIGWLHPKDGRQSSLEPLGVHPDFQRLGLGTAILRVGLHRLQLLGATSVTLFTNADNNIAIHLYENEGFCLQCREHGYGRLFHPGHQGAAHDL